MLCCIVGNVLNTAASGIVPDLGVGGGGASGTMPVGAVLRTLLQPHPSSVTFRNKATGQHSAVCQ